MSTSFAVDWTIQELPLDGTDLTELWDTISRNLYGTIGDTVLGANRDPDAEDGFPRFDGTGWNILGPDLEYIPAKVKVNNISLSASPTDNRIQNVQDKNGTIALLDDVYEARNTVYLKEGLAVINCAISSNFICVLSSNRQPAFYVANSKPGMKVKVLVVNNGTKQTVGTWDPAIRWVGGAAPSIPLATAGGATSLLVTLRNVEGIIYAETTNSSHQPIPNKAEATGLIST